MKGTFTVYSKSYLFNIQNILYQRVSKDSVTHCIIESNYLLKRKYLYYLMT